MHFIMRIICRRSDRGNFQSGIQERSPSCQNVGPSGPFCRGGACANISTIGKQSPNKRLNYTKFINKLPIVSGVMMGGRSSTLAAGVCGVLVVGYCIYFDRKRRSDPNFKNRLRERECWPPPSAPVSACLRETTWRITASKCQSKVELVYPNYSWLTRYGSLDLM